MRLFHYTHPGTYLRIAAEGLLPHCKEDDALMTGGVPVVWLTRETSNIATAAHIEHYVKLGVSEFKVGELMYGGTARLEVQLERSNRKLMRYVDFVRKTKCIPKLMLSRTAQTSWWVYLGVIPPHKIEPIDAATMLACLAWHIKTYPDLKARERLKAVRKQIKRLSLPPDARILVRAEPDGKHFKLTVTKLKPGVG
jgi:hypothetical protein